jgi:ribonuclease HI
MTTPPKVPPATPVVVTDRPYTTAYTDGSSTGGWGPGGWGWCVIEGPRAGAEGSGGCGWTTNQREELKAAHEAMLAIPGLLLIVADSQYVINGFTQWLNGWIRKDWAKVSNDDLWRPAAETYLARNGEVRFAWMKGHSGHPGNERADELAGAARLAVPFEEWGPTDPEQRALYLSHKTPNGKYVKPTMEMTR